jgi:hypothetical protein|tara:strand:+ start:264 stop:467 length:204 start_codon:yes stop_codon:yes gene_type:complete
MDIKNAKYYQGVKVNSDNKLIADGVNQGIEATINNVQMWVPLDPDNADFAEIQRQVAAGKLTIADAD